MSEYKGNHLEEIPVVDFSSCSIEKEEFLREDLVKIGKQITKSFYEFGCVYLKGAGISDEYFRHFNDVTNVFFTASKEEKVKYKQVMFTGYLELGGTNTNQDTPSDYHEAFFLSGDNHKTAKMPNEIAPNFSSLMYDYMDKGKRLGARTHRAIALGLNLKDEFFFEKYFDRIGSDKNVTTAKTLYYPPIGKDLKPGQVRLGEHIDYTTISFIYQDDVGGLEIGKPDGGYMEANCIPDTVLVIVGDVLAYLSGGDIQGLKHRVTIPESTKRLNSVRRSLCYFFHPNNDMPMDQTFVFKDEALNQKMRAKAKMAEPGLLYGQYLAKWLGSLFDKNILFSEIFNVTSD